MKDYVNHIEVKVQDVVYIDFGCNVNNEINIVAEIAILPHTLMGLAQLLNETISQMEANQKAAQSMN